MNLNRVAIGAHKDSRFQFESKEGTFSECLNKHAENKKAPPVWQGFLSFNGLYYSG